MIFLKIEGIIVEFVHDFFNLIVAALKSILGGNEIIVGEYGVASYKHIKELINLDEERTAEEVKCPTLVNLNLRKLIDDITRGSFKHDNVFDPFFKIFNNKVYGRTEKQQSRCIKFFFWRIV